MYNCRHSVSQPALSGIQYVRYNSNNPVRQRRACLGSRLHVACPGQLERRGFPEYWIVDPEELLVTVLTLAGTEYKVVQECHSGEIARSLLLTGLEVSVDQIWALAGES